MKLFRLLKYINPAFSFFIAFMCCQVMPAHAQTTKIAITPFIINSEKDLNYIKEGVFQMLSSRLAWKDKVIIIPQKKILDQINKTQLSGVSLVKFITERTDVQYVISGSITEFEGSFSLDTKIYADTSGIPFNTFFRQAQATDEIIPEMSIIAAQINQSVLKRNVPIPTGEKNRQINTREDISRANPEKLIPEFIQDTPPPKKPFWMFWKKEKTPAYPGEDFSVTETSPPQDLEPDDYLTGEEKIPFWKFWKKKSRNGIDDDDLDADSMVIPKT